MPSPFSLFAHSALAGALLRPNVVVDGDVVKLGDLFDNVGAKADVAVARAPAPGKRATLDADWLQRVADDERRRSGVRRTSFEQAVVERSGVSVTHDQIEAELLVALADQGVPADSQIELANRAAQIVVPIGVPLQVGVRDLFYDSHYKRFTATVEVPANVAQRHSACGSPAGSSRPSTFRSWPARSAGAMSSRRSDLTWIKVREDAVRRDILTDADQIIGLTPRQTVARRPDDLDEPTCKSRSPSPRGALVTMVLKYGAMSLTAQGHAVEPGSIGDVIRVTNSHSNLTVEGKVEAPNLVSVSLERRHRLGQLRRMIMSRRLPSFLRTAALRRPHRHGRAAAISSRACRKWASRRAYRASRTPPRRPTTSRSACPCRRRPPRRPAPTRCGGRARGPSSRTSGRPKSATS